MPSSPSRPALTVLQVVPALDTGGAERTTIDIAEALAARGDRALVASEGGRLEAELARAGGVFVRLPLGSKSPVAICRNAIRLARLLRREDVGLVHARSRAPAWSALIACRLTGIPFVTTFHGIYGDGNAAKRFYNSVMARGDAVIANSRYTARVIVERYGAAGERVVVIPRGTDLTRFDLATISEERRAVLRKRWNLSGSERVILNLARLTGWKGQRVLIEAAAHASLAARSDIAVVLAGDAQGREQYQRKLESLIAERGLQQTVRIVGHCDDAPAALALADVVVIASTEPEAFGRTAIEAAAMGVPVVASALGATTETVLAPLHAPAAVRTGWLVPPNDKVALAKAIDEALRLAPDERTALASRARKHARGFTTEAMQQATLFLYDRLLAKANADSFSKR